MPVSEQYHEAPIPHCQLAWLLCAAAEQLGLAREEFQCCAGRGYRGTNVSDSGFLVNLRLEIFENSLVDHLVGWLISVGDERRGEVSRCV